MQKGLLAKSVKQWCAAGAALFALSTPALAELDLKNLGTPDIDDIEYPDDEPHSEAEVSLGKQLFFDTRLSKNNNQSCASCHNPELGLSDGLDKGIGTSGTILGRNAPHIYNLAWGVTFFWDGRAASLEEQALGPIMSEAEMQMTPEITLKRLEKISDYTKAFTSIYEDGLTFENVGRAIAAFERTIIADNTAFDQYLAGNSEAMSPAAVRGLSLFVGKGNCVACHDGANFTDESFHNIGLADGDEGRYAISKDKTQMGAFKTPGLRNILFSAPYMHDGSLGTLQAVVEHYNQGAPNVPNVSKLIKPLNLSKQEVSDLVAFMAALSDPIVIKRPTLPKD
jgi:cytochrome c peroxidase